MSLKHQNSEMILTNNRVSKCYSNRNVGIKFKNKIDLKFYSY